MLLRGITTIRIGLSSIFNTSGQVDVTTDNATAQDVADFIVNISTGLVVVEGQPAVIRLNYSSRVGNTLNLAAPFPFEGGASDGNQVRSYQIAPDAQAADDELNTASDDVVTSINF